MYVTSPKSLFLFSLCLVAGVRAAFSEQSVPVSPCNGNSSLYCITNKLIVAMRRINNIPEIPITEWMSLVPSPDVIREENSLELPKAESRKHRSPNLLQALATTIDDFINSRNIRFSLPSWASGSGRSIDVDFNQAYSEVTGRGKKNKMNMAMMGMMVLGKVMMMTMAMVKMKAMKAMMIGSIALMLSKFQLLKMMMSKKDEGETKHVVVVTTGHGGGGHGGGGHSSHPPSDSYGPPANNNGGGGGYPNSAGWSNGGGGGGWSGGGGGGGWSSGGGGGDSWEGGGGGHGGGWGRRAYGYQTPEPIPIQNDMTPPPNQ